MRLVTILLICLVAGVGGGLIHNVLSAHENEMARCVLACQHAELFFPRKAAFRSPCSVLSFKAPTKVGSQPVEILQLSPSACLLKSPADTGLQRTTDKTGLQNPSCPLQIPCAGLLPSQFDAHFGDVVDSMENRVIRTMQDKTAAAVAVSTVFSVPPGGRSFFPTFQPFAAQMLAISEGVSIFIQSIIYPEEREPFEAYMRNRTADVAVTFSNVFGLPYDQAFATVRVRHHSIQQPFASASACVRQQASYPSCPDACQAIFSPGIVDFIPRVDTQGRFDTFAAPASDEMALPSGPNNSRPFFTPIVHVRSPQYPLLDGGRRRQGRRHILSRQRMPHLLLSQRRALRSSRASLWVDLSTCAISATFGQYRTSVSKRALLASPDWACICRTSSKGRSNTPRF